MTKYELGNILIYEQPTKYIVKSENYDDSFPVPVLTPGQTFILGYTAETEGVYSAPLPVIIFDDFTTATKLVNFPFKVKSSAMKILKPANENVFLPYWYYFLSSLKVDNGLHKRYWISTFANRQVHCPSFQEQKRIAEQLDKVQKLIAKQKEQIATLDLLIKSRFLDMFGDPISNPKKWRKEKIFDVIETNISKVKSKYTEDDTIKYVDISSIDNITNTVRRFTTYLVKNAPSRAQQCLLKDDILISTVRPNLRNIAINNRTDCNMVASSGFCVLRSNVCNPMWLFEIIKSNEFTSYLSNLTTGANYPAVKDHDVYNYLFPCPPVILQNQFANFVKSVEQQKEVFSTRLSHFETLYKSLMQEYFG